MANDDDILTGTVPEPDAEITASERAQAKTFAELVDKTLAGRTPPAMSTDDRALLEVATVIRATHGGLELSAAKKRNLVEDALKRGIGGAASTTSGDVARIASVTPIGSSRTKRWAPWVVASVSTALAAAAVIALWLRAPAHDHTAQAFSHDDDALIGPIAREHSGDASARIDAIFADRLEGFRDRRLTVRTRGGKP
ncbi:MAG TPA: hypothetical protein VGO00_13050 [Kofleriaceae bacterium]|jgi:hypothetical protein|nr:hypothetical protein [Kofleriaceae bacterium]